MSKFGNILNVKAGSQKGVFVLDGTGASWTTGQGPSKHDIQLNKEQIVNVGWISCGSRAILNILGKNDKEENVYCKLDGFDARDFSKFRKLFKEHFDVDAVQESYASNGVNAGTAEIQDTKNCLVFKYNDATSMEIPFELVSQCVAPGKNEVEMHFVEDMKREDEMMIEMKFYVPPGEEDEDLSNDLCSKIEEFVQTDVNVGTPLVTFPDEVGNFLTPRGKYAVKMFEKYFTMVGGTYSYKISYISIKQMFLLPLRDGVNALVISLKNPIQQGSQRYADLVLSIDALDIQPGVLDIEVQIPDELLEKRFDGKLDVNPHGNLCHATAKLFKSFSSAKVLVPGDHYKSSLDDKMVKCALKSAQGYLFPLQKSFMFIHNPTIWIRYEDVQYVEFARYGGTSSATKNFDLAVTQRPVGGESSKVYTFSAIEKSEFKALHAFLSSRKLKIKNADAYLADEQDSKEVAQLFGDDEEESDDVDFASGDESHESSDSDSDVSLVSESGLHAEDDEEPSKRKVDEADDGDAPKKKKAKRDPNAPTKAASAYIFFSKDIRAEVSAAASSQEEVMKMIGDRWSKLSDADKVKYDEMHLEAKKRYDEEMTSYKPPEGFTTTGAAKVSNSKPAKEGKKGKAPKDPNAPKRPSTSYLYFSMEEGPKVRADNPGMKMGDVSKLVGEKWKALQPEDKVKYEDMSSKDKERYESEMKNYKPATIATSSNEKKTKAPSNEKKKKTESLKTKKETPVDTKSSSSSSSSSGSSSSGSSSDSSED